ncbi:AI-2E family transporter [Ilumatobacter nonamiensis]|uniref:AI-2E family transporter n=1 Tax=Ilumatobacter nonamiensis TaxID=467093 RepID=UPI0011D2BC05|nr:AI-2E family transporter [Ilumatobacter nonamiensis]
MPEATSPAPDRRRAGVGSGAQARIRQWGMTSWWIVGIILAIGLGYSLIMAFSGLVVPLLLAVVVGALGVPVVDWLQRHRVPRSAGALLLIAIFGAVLIVTTILVINGIVRETLEIRATLIDGVDEIDQWLADGDVLGDGESIVGTGFDQGPTWLSGVATWAGTVFSSTMAFAIGVFLATFMLYYILVDWVRVRNWLARHLGVAPELGTAILDDATMIFRRGFGALTLTSLVTASVIGLAMIVLDLPLVIAVVGVTFITSYVPYLGAILSGVFAFLVALGSGGPQQAFVLLVVVLVAQNIIQTVVGNRLTSDRLSLHPLPSIISSVCGVAIAGLLGAMLSAPALALAIAVNKRLRSPELVPGIEEHIGSVPQGAEPENP